MQDELAAIQKRRRAWIVAINEGDVVAHAALLAEDAVWLPPGQPAVAGREAIAEWLLPFFEQHGYDFSITDARVRVAGDWAVERATFTSRLTPTDGGETMTHTGTYVLLWRREADGWYIERYVDDTALPGNGPQEAA